MRGKEINRRFRLKLRDRNQYQKLKSVKDSLRRTFKNRNIFSNEDFNKASERLRGSFQYKGARLVYVSLHPALEQVRFNALLDNKFLVVPDAGLNKGFYLLDPVRIRFRNRLAAVRSSAGIRKYGVKLDYRKKRALKVKLVISEALCACPVSGAVLGDGMGFLDLNLAVLNFLGWLDSNPVTAIIVGSDGVSLQGKIVMKENDWWADLVVCPSEVFYASKPAFSTPVLIAEILDEKRIRRSDVLFHIFRNSQTGKKLLERFLV